MTVAPRPLADVLAHITLDRLNEDAALLTRTDRKYIVSNDVLDLLLSSNRSTLAMLDIDGQREFSYESVYFDTADLRLYRDAATSRRVRFKVRTRIYRDTGTAMLEVKAKNGRGQTVKSRLDYCADDQHRLTDEALAFIDELAGHPGLAVSLQPVLTTTYRRTTLVDLTPGSRYTVDRGLECTDADGTSIALDEVIIETKSDGRPSVLDRWFWQHGVRPTRISKYCTALAALRPDLPANKWHRTLARHFHGSPATSSDVRNRPQ
jgi:VTC domain